MHSGTKSSHHPYFRAAVCLLTKHKKERVIAPVLQQGLGIELKVDDGFDTDALGNFTRTIARADNQLATAEKKARLAARRSGIGIGSEGSFDSSALGGLACVNSEILVWFDAKCNCCVSAQHQTVVSAANLTTDDYAQLEKYARESGFPEQGIVLRADNDSDPNPVIGIQSVNQLERAFVDCLSRSAQNQVFAEWDFRAHCCPVRMHTIGKAAEQLLEHLLRLCPTCHTPGYSPFKVLSGLPCEQCQAPTAITRGRYFRCGVCAASHFESVSDAFANPFNCSICNP